MHQIHRLGRERNHAVDRGDELIWIELRRSRRGRDECTLRGVKLAIGDSERIAWEYARVRTIHDRVVMECMPGSVNQLEVAAGQVEVLTVLHDPHPRCRNRHQLAVQLCEALLSVDDLRARYQLLGIDHVRRPARVNYRERVWQRTHDYASTAGVIQMHVSEKHIVDRLSGDFQEVERTQQVRNGVVRSHIDECRAPVLLDDMGCSVPRMQVFGIDSDDSVRVSTNSRVHGCSGFGQHSRLRTLVPIRF